MAMKKVNTLRTRPYDSAEYLDTARAISAYLEEALKTHDPALIVRARATAARASSIASVRRENWLSRKRV